MSEPEVTQRLKVWHLIAALDPAGKEVARLWSPGIDAARMVLLSTGALHWGEEYGYKILKTELR